MGGEMGEKKEKETREVSRRENQKRRTKRSHQRLTSIIEMEPGTIHAMVQEFGARPTPTTTTTTTTTKPPHSSKLAQIATKVVGALRTSTREERDLLREIHDLKNELQRRKNEK